MAAARRGGPGLAGPDLEHAVAAAAPLVAEAGPDDPAAAAAGIGATVAAMQRLTVPPSADRPVDWSRFGVVIPILAGSAGAGASVLAAALADALGQAGRRVLLVDAADPARSGLAQACPAEGVEVRDVHPGLRCGTRGAPRSWWRGWSRATRSPRAWCPRRRRGCPTRGPVQATVVDVGHDGWRAAADPLLGAGGWLRRGQPGPLPVLVVRATRPSLVAAEQVLARLHRWITARVAAPPARLVVVGARRWPRGVTGAAGRRLAPLLDDAVFLPRHRQVETGGVTGDLLPRPLLGAVTPLLQDWQLLDHPRKGRR